MPSTTSPRFYALVPCAGAGARSKAAVPKQYLQIAGRPMVGHTLAALAGVARLENIMVVLKADDDMFSQCVPEYRGLVAPVGGQTRAETVLNGLSTLLQMGIAETDWVLVHDAARCLVRTEWIDTLIDACSNDPVGGLLALPLADTLKEATAESKVLSTLSRQGKWQAQTPQMFRLGMLHKALGQALATTQLAITDESSALEAAGHQPRLVPGSVENFKVTFPEDFNLAERLLRTRT